MPKVTAPYAPGTPCWVDLMVPDQQAALDFYRDLFGWEGEVGSDETGGYAVCTKLGLPVAGIGPVMAEGAPTVWTTYLASADARATLAAVKEAGGTPMTPVMDVLTLGSMFVAADPSGAVFGVWGHRDFIGAQLVNEPGALVWNECNTRDVNSAMAFYHSVFGAGYGEAMPGYEEFRIDGRPVGGMQQMTDPPFLPDVPSHWLTYFSVDDVDSTVDAAVKRGADVLMPAKDTPVGRMATVSDPWGAVFAVIAVSTPG
ncbi:VOC family protein [Streptacidiphilus albus]|uniref:VOC family protein n=1 Tax=Streptacidiphilus albus TaxID=105425 RepID=UPI00054BBC2B|nr:VOC family protein [Streptacidiphilus albus]